MHYIQQNVFLPVEDTKTFTLIESIPSGEKKSAAGPTRRVPKQT